jgi:O-antigen/teichoic acid export membrane protein
MSGAGHFSPRTASVPDLVEPVVIEQPGNLPHAPASMEKGGNSVPDGADTPQPPQGSDAFGDRKHAAGLSGDPPDGTAGRLRQMLGNIGWLVGGKGFGAVCSLVYLAILARSLGLEQFGHFALIFGSAQALVSIVGFQTWQTVVRFGAAPLHAGDHETFGRLAILCGAIDAAAALAGCLLAAGVYEGFADELGLNPSLVPMAFAFTCAVLWARTTAANGIVRVVGRFDVATYVEAIVPIGRLAAALAIWVSGPSVFAFLLAWALIELTAGAAYWIAAKRLVPDALRLAHIGNFSSAVASHPGIGRFLGITYLTSAADALLKQGPLLAVGYFLSTSAAGLYRLADQLAQGLGKGAALFARAIYAEIARARVAIPHDAFRRLIAQVSAIATLGGTMITLVAALAGRQLLGLIGGSDFAAGHAVLLPLAIAASIELAAVAYEPVLHSASRAALPLVAKLCGIAAVVVAGAVLIGSGSTGVAWSVAIGYLAYFLVITPLTWLVLSRRQAAASRG